MSSAALISSPLQAITLLEAVDASFVSPDSIYIAPQLVLEPALQSDLSNIAKCRKARISSIPKIALTSSLIIGDIYSQFAQLSIATARASSVTILEDGVATYRAMRQLAEGKPLIRAASDRPNSPLANLAQRKFQSHLSEGSIEWVLHREFMMKPCRVTPHYFHRMLSRRSERHLGITTVVAGSALAADGYIHNDRYLKWVHSVCSQNRQTLYVPHRRETEESVRVAVTAGAVIDNSGSAFEQILCDAPNVHSVYSLPTTPALTAQIIRPDVELILENINDWWQQPGPGGMREVVAIVHEILSEAS